MGSKNPAASFTGRGKRKGARTLRSCAHCAIAKFYGLGFRPDKTLFFVGFEVRLLDRNSPDFSLNPEVDRLRAPAGNRDFLVVFGDLADREVCLGMNVTIGRGKTVRVADEEVCPCDQLSDLMR